MAIEEMYQQVPAVAASTQHQHIREIQSNGDAVGLVVARKEGPLFGGPCGKAGMTDVKGSHEAEGWRAGPAGTPGPADRQDGSAEASANPAGSVVGPRRKKDSSSLSPRDDLGALVSLSYISHTINDKKISHTWNTK